MKNYKLYNGFLNRILNEKENKNIENYTDIVSKIIIARNEKGYTRKQLAFLAGVSTRTVAKLEKCKSIKLEDFIKILNKLDLSLGIGKKYKKYNIRIIDILE